MPSRLSGLIAAAGATRPLLVVLAGSNGAGKSTFYAEALSGTGYPLVNADEIARYLSISSGRPVGDLAFEAMRRADDLRNDLVAQRVANGGHDVPDGKLRARFGRTRANAVKALAMADAGLVFDNSDPESPFRWVETWETGRRVSRAEYRE